MPRDILGIRFACNVAIATSLIWYALAYLADTNPLWAIASMVAAADPQVDEARRMFRSRLINVLVGGIVGLLFLIIGGPAEWTLPLALGVTVLLSCHSGSDDVAPGADHGRHRHRLRRILSLCGKRRRARAAQGRRGGVRLPGGRRRELGNVESLTDPTA